MTKPLINEAEMAKLLGCSLRHIKDMRYRRMIPYIQLAKGGRGPSGIRYNPEAVARAIEKLTVKERI
jgi:hypothetical protein